MGEFLIGNRFQVTPCIVSLEILCK